MKFFLASSYLMQQFDASVDIREVLDAETVGGVESGEEELTTGVPDVLQLEQVGRREQGLDVVLGDLHLGRVDVLDERAQGQGIHVLERDAILAALLETWKSQKC